MRVKLVVAYDGTEFCGWAAQTGRRTVQGTLTEAVRRVSGEENEIFGASRTDGGAHARGQVCHFDTNSPMPVHKWVPVLNKALPGDISVMRSSRVAPQFESRFYAIDRHYRYRIHCGHRDPFRSGYVHEYGKPLDVSLMKEAASILQGTHDFLAFTEELEPTVLNTVRTLFSIDVNQRGDEVWVDVVGTAFLRGMMRRISGALLEVGRGRRPVVEVSRLLTKEGQDSLQWPVVLPAKGLCLMRIRYGRHPQDTRTASSTIDVASPQG